MDIVFFVCRNWMGKLRLNLSTWLRALRINIVMVCMYNSFYVGWVYIDTDCMYRPGIYDSIDVRAFLSPVTGIIFDEYVDVKVVDTGKNIRNICRVSYGTSNRDIYYVEQWTLCLAESDCLFGFVFSYSCLFACNFNVWPYSYSLLYYYIGSLDSKK